LKLTSKAELLKALTDAFSYCDAVYADMSDASGMQMIEVAGPDNRKVQAPRISRLILNYAPNNEHYGNMVTYYRIKSMVPPSTAQGAN
jgi:hypothetical protein